MGFRVKHPLVQAYQVVVRKDQIQIFQCLCQKETLLDIIMGWWHLVHIADTAEPVTSMTMFLNGLL